MAPTSPTNPRKLLSLWSPWWWFILYHSNPKRRENRDWPSIPDITRWGATLWLHASLKSGEDVEATLRTVLNGIPHEGEKPNLDRIQACAGHIVGRARVVTIERNTPEICARDRWAMIGQLGIVLTDVVPLDMPIPWKGGQGLVEVSPAHIEVARIITSNGGLYHPEKHLTVGADIRRAIPPTETVGTILTSMVALGQLRMLHDHYAVRSYPTDRKPNDLSPMLLPRNAGPRQVGWKW